MKMVISPRGLQNYKTTQSNPTRGLAQGTSCVRVDETINRSKSRAETMFAVRGACGDKSLSRRCMGYVGR